LVKYLWELLYNDILGQMNKWIWILLAVLIMGGLGWWAVKSMTNLPGEAVADQGRDHKNREENDKFTYNSNPPTSGPHDPDWIRSGVYDTPQDKYKLIHSLEHGYIIIHYNCVFGQPLQPLNWYPGLIKNVFAHEDEGDLDKDSSPSAGFENVIGTSLEWNSEECKQLRVQLGDFKGKLGLSRIIVQPNLEIKRRIVITAWNRKLVMDTWDEKEVTRFARTFHNKGPEQTME